MKFSNSLNNTESNYYPSIYLARSNN